MISIEVVQVVVDFWKDKVCLKREIYVARLPCGSLTVTLVVVSDCEIVKFSRFMVEEETQAEEKHKKEGE